MNLLDRIRPLQLAMLAAGFFFSCESGTSSFDFDLENNTRVQLVELVLPSRSIFIDSLRTDNESRLIAGNYSDERFGSIKAEAYSEVTFVEGQIIYDTLQYDSLIVNLTIDNFLTNDPGFQASFSLHKLSEEFETSLVYLKENKMGIRAQIDSVSFPLIPTLDSQTQNVSFKANKWGRDIFTKITVDSVGQIINATVDNIALIPIEGNQTAISINLDSDSTELVLYSSYDTIAYETKFRLTSNNHSYISRVTTGNENNNMDDAAVFDMSDDSQLISSLFGVYNYVDLTPLQEFIASNKTLLINQAEINTSVQASSRDEVSEMRYYFYDEQYGFRGEGIFENAFLNAVLSNTAYLEGSSTLLVSEFNSEDEIYEQDITFFIESFANYYSEEGEFFANGLVLTPAEFVTLQESLLRNPSSTSIIIYATSIE